MLMASIPLGEMASKCCETHMLHVVQQASDIQISALIGDWSPMFISFIT